MFTDYQDASRKVIFDYLSLHSKLFRRIPSQGAYNRKLFDEGISSDIAIEFVYEKFQGGKTQMKLHKLILMQLPYFAALFGNNWAEANKDTIKIIIDDDNITERCKKRFSTNHLVFTNAFCSQLFESSSKACILAS